MMIFHSSCEVKDNEPLLEGWEVANQWAEMSLYIAKNTGANSPTYASRCFGYIGLTMYEAVVYGAAEYHSLQGQLNGLEGLPIPDDESYDWLVSFNASQAKILLSLYNQTLDSNKVKIQNLETRILKNLSQEIKDKGIINRSVAYGESLASQIFEWSKTDGGHRAYLNNFDKEWSRDPFLGSWKPALFAQSFSHHPLHPHWGDNRTFLLANSNLEIPEMIEYNTDPNSVYYKQFLAVYNQDLKLTQEEKEIALWWGDDPDDTFTPPGHSFFIATKVVQAKKPSIVESAETFARVGMAVADAFINCWEWKYHHFTERPNTYIPQFIDEEWESFWPDPPFPSFPSGHAIQAAAAATVLIDLYGEEFNFVDDSHVRRERDEVRDVDFKVRTFSTFWDVAKETADSRFYGGIHIPEDNRVGLEEGARIGNSVNQLNWKK